MMTYSLYKCSAIVNGTATNLISDADYAAVELFHGYDDGLLTFASVCCVIFMIIGIPGNLTTVVALAKYKKVHNATAVFIMNMSFTDMLLLCLDAPITISKFMTKSWRYGRVLCELYPLVKFLLEAVSVFSIIAITINRYILIGHPKLYRKIFQKRNMVIMLAAIWLSPLLTIIPTYLGKWGCYNLDQSVGSCTVVPDRNNRSAKTILFMSVLGLPSILIFVCYSRILIIVRNSTKRTQNAANPSPIRNFEDEESTKHSSLMNECPSDISEIKRELSASKVIANSKSEFNKPTSLRLPAGSVTEPPRIQRNALQRSMILLKPLLPTRKDKRLRTMIATVIVSFCVCHLPMAIVATVYEISPQLLIASYILLNLSRCVNPVIYVVMSKEYKQAYKNLFKCLKRVKKSLI